MSGTTVASGNRQPLIKRMKRGLAAAAVTAMLLAGTWTGLSEPVSAGGETRTLSLYHVHTGESLQITYKIGGRYVPSAMQKINRLMRDWRRNETVTMSPRTIDLMWELHADLGSRAPIHIVCGYRSPRTNSFLKRIGRNVARKSQHMVGKAIDLYFPDVSTEKIRNSALVRQVGGVGYYRRSGGPSGFVHIDSGNVRHWPRISPRNFAKIMRDYRSTVGRRLSRSDQVMLASADIKSVKPVKLGPSLYSGEFEVNDDEEAGDAKSASKKDKPAAAAVVVIPRQKPDMQQPGVQDQQENAAPPAAAGLIAEADVTIGYPVPKPRQKPVEILFQEAMNMTIEPVSAPPEAQNWTRKSKPAADPQGVVIVNAEDDAFPESNEGGKSNLDVAVKPKSKPAIRSTTTASAAGEDVFWFQNATGSEEEAQAGQPLVKKTASRSIKRKPADSVGDASGKGDLLVVNRSGKGDLDLSLLTKRRKVGELKAGNEVE